MIVSRSRHRGDKVVATFFRAEPLETRAKQRPQRLDRPAAPEGGNALFVFALPE